MFVSADAAPCRARDPKGLYAAAASGHVQQLTGVSALYEAPLPPELVIDTTTMSVSAAADLELVQARGIVAG